MTAGKRGPAPTPTALRVIRGDRKDRINLHEPKPRSFGAETPPASLSTAARPVWRETVNRLRGTRVLTAADRETLAVYCEHVVNHRALVDQVRTYGFLLRGARPDRPDLIKNPAVGMMAREAIIVRAYASEFGLTPSSRSGLVEMPAGRNDLESLLS